MTNRMTATQLHKRLLPAVETLNSAIARGNRAVNTTGLFGLGACLVSGETLQELVIAAEMWRSVATKVWSETDGGGPEGQPAEARAVRQILERIWRHISTSAQTDNAYLAGALLALWVEAKAAPFAASVGGWSIAIGRTGDDGEDEPQPDPLPVVPASPKVDA